MNRMIRSPAAGVLMTLLLALATPDSDARGRWVTLENCTLVPNPSNDGDSFHVRAGRKEYIFRLYFVDTPETDPTLAERVSEQARYFGITMAQTLQVGEVARRFSAEKLSRPFTVRTSMQDALGRSRKERFYAFVRIGQEDLAEELVRNGLARVHGSSGKPDGLLTANAEWARLEQLEADAKGEKVGGWGVNFNRMSVRSQKEGGRPYDPFDAFFHAPAAATPGPVVAGKLDVNSATQQQLEDLPGIGPALAGRIMAARPFRSADDLRHVKGIGDVRYQKIRAYFQ
jgi:DNA uptake protein ComE-like DNA-binding protein